MDRLTLLFTLFVSCMPRQAVSASLFSLEPLLTPTIHNPGPVLGDLQYAQRGSSLKITSSSSKTGQGVRFGTESSIPRKYPRERNGVMIDGRSAYRVAEPPLPESLPVNPAESAFKALLEKIKDTSDNLDFSKVTDAMVKTMGRFEVLDPTFGRASLPYSAMEMKIRSDPKITHWDARIFLDEDGKPSMTQTKRWISYQVWWNTKANPSNNLDLCICHGIGDYGGSTSWHAQRFLDQGYRMIVIDLPSHGRSTGLHVHLTDLDQLAHAIHVVLANVAKADVNLTGRQRPAVVAGPSMGGFATLYYGLVYHSPKFHKPDFKPIEVEHKPNVVGLLALCPMLGIAPEMKPSPALEVAARYLASIAGEFPLIQLKINDKNSAPIKDLAHFFEDPQTYNGGLRAATAMAILKGLDDIERDGENLRLPFMIMHGDADQVTSCAESKRFFNRIPIKDKAIKTYPKVNHNMLRLGKDEKDDQERQTVIGDMLQWLDHLRQTYTK